MFEDNKQTPQLLENAVTSSYNWHCKFTYGDDKMPCYLTSKNNCKTFKELRRLWRIEKPNLKLISAVRK
jgi:hypothetical protein